MGYSFHGYSINLDYVNPKHLLNAAQGIILPNKSVDIKEVQTLAPKYDMSIIRASGSLFIRIAGFCGASAVAMGAYGSHGFYNKPDIPSELKDVYRIANYYHFMHSLALLAVPLTRRPLLVGSLLVTGMSIFCGTCYAYALTGNKSFAQFTPYGGTLLIIAWLSMML